MGVETPELNSASTVSELIGNKDGNTVRIAASALAAQLSLDAIAVNKETRAQLYADLGWAAGTRAAVWGDTTEAQRGIYLKSGAAGSGSWSRIGDLPMTALSSAQLAAKADQSALDTALNELRQRAGGVALRPGEAPDAWAIWPATGTGAPEAGTAIVPGSTAGITVNQRIERGRVLTITDRDITVGPRATWPVHAEMVYRIDVWDARERNPVDPEGDAVRILLACLDADYGLVQTITLTAARLEAGPVRHLTATFAISTALGTPDRYLDPASVQVRPIIRTYGTDHETDLIQVQIKDITEAAQIAGGLDVLALTAARESAVAAASAAATARTAAQAAEAAAQASATTASTAAANALAAEVNVEAAFANANVYETASAGRASVADGGQFIVAAAGATEFVRYRRDSSTTQTELARYPTAAFVAAEKARALAWNHARNAFPDPFFQGAGALVYAGGWSYLAVFPMSAVTRNGRRALQTPASASAILTEAPLVAVSEFPSGRVSASVVIEEKDATSAGADLRLRLRFYASDGLTLVPLSMNTGSDNPGDLNAYDRYTPTAAITKPQFLSVAEGVLIPSGAAFVRMSWRIQTTARMVCSLPTLRDGDNPAWVAPASSSAVASGPAVTVGTGGTYATIDSALDAIGGAGTIILKHGRAYGTEMRITASKCLGPVSIIGEPSLTTGQRPRIILAQPVTGIEAVAGYGGRVFRFPVTGITQTPPWVWLHETPDAATAIALADRRPLHNGRAHRLPSTRINRIANAGSLAATLTAMQASNSPQCFYDSNWIYCTGVNGASLLGADIRIGQSTGLISGGSLLGAARITIQCLDVWYGGIASNRFEVADITDVMVLGARGNGIDHAGVTHLRYVETAGSGSFVDPTGDGVNGHTYAVLTGEAIWSHDNLDDGESNHENGRTRIRSSLMEYNGGTAVAPAYGCEAIYEDCESLSNQQVIGRKAGAFLAVGTPSEGTPVDTGVDTIAVFRRCVSRNDTVSFKDFFVSTSGVVRAICEDCVSINAATMAFDVFEVSNCRVVGPATAKNAATTVRAQGVLVS